MALLASACSDDTAGTGGSGAAGGGAEGGTSHGGSGTGGAGASSSGGGGEGGAPVETELVHAVGRFDLTDPNAPVSSWSGTSFRVHIEGTGVSVHLDGAQNVWFQIVVDGAPTGTLVTEGGDATYVVAEGLSAGEHDVEIFRRNEGFFGNVTFKGFEPGDATTLVPSPSPYAHKLEFVGDSITCGYGAEGAPGCSFSADTESAFATYAAIAARNVGAAAHYIAYSGKGMHENCCGDTSETMPELYLRTLTGDSGPTWDFSRFVPDVVVVNLGTNDFNSNVDEAGFVADYVTFLGLLKEKYPAAKIVCVKWAIWGQGNEQLVEDAVSEFGSADVRTVEFQWDTAGDGVGCDYHPNTVTHAKLGDVLTDVLTDVLGS